MRICLLASFLFFSTGYIFAQRDLSNSLRHSFFTYAYRISAREALVLFRSDMRHMDEKYLHTLADSFPEEAIKDEGLAPGNYVFIHASGSGLFSELKTIGDLQVECINNNHDLAISLHDRQGQLIPDAMASIGRTKIPYDPVTRTYLLPKRKKGGNISVVWRGALYFFAAQYTGGAPRNPFHRTPYYKPRNQTPSYLSKFHSFVLFSKPIYRPGDTVQGKAFIFNRNGKPVGRMLSMRIRDSYKTVDTLVATLRPYRSGGYIFSFVLTDSLHLDLDRSYDISLEELKGRHAKKPDKDGSDDDDDDDEGDKKRKVLAKGSFRYEDYELQSLRFEGRADKEEVSPGNLLSLYLKATDENDLPMPDARVEIMVFAHQPGQFRQKALFIKDTLWDHVQLLDLVGETKITIPDSIFPAARINYEIACVLLTSNNEYRDKDFSGIYDPDSARVIFRQDQDSLNIDYRFMNVSRPVQAIWWACDARGVTLAKRQVELPVTLPLYPYAAVYRVITLADSVLGKFEMVSQRRMIRFDTERTKDSVHIVTDNPRKLNFWYSLFAGNTLIERGNTPTLAYHARSVTARSYFISVEYPWGGQIIRDDYILPYRDKLLRVEMQAPVSVYPGQESEIAIAVKDADGRPVPDADLTALSYTSKFDNAPRPSVPYLGMVYPRRKLLPNFNVDQEKRWDRTVPLNWERWSREMGLDTSEYYIFLHPATMYANTEPAGNGLTQVAPFVVSKGVLEPVHQLYIDEKPVFFSQAQQLSRYSFLVKPGRHSLRLRTAGKMIRVDSLWVEKDKKTFICVNADSSGNGIHVEKMPDTLTNYEKILWQRYMILVQDNFGGHFGSISQGSTNYLLNYPVPFTPTPFEKLLGVTRSAPLFTAPNGASLVGPFSDQDAILHVKTQFDQSFEPEGGYQFLVSKGLVKQKQLREAGVFRSYLDPQASPVLFAIPDFHDLVLTAAEVDSLWQDWLDDRCAYTDLFRNGDPGRRNNGALEIGIARSWHGGNPFIRNIFLFRNDEPYFIHVYKGVQRLLGNLQPGQYRLLVLLKGNRYMIRDSVQIFKDGLNYYEIDSLPVHAKDSMSMHMAEGVNNQDKNWQVSVTGPELDEVKESFNEKYLDLSKFGRAISGRVQDPNGNALSGVSITIKGTRTGVATDRQGYFHIATPERGILVFAYIGYSSIEKAIRENSSYEIKLQPVAQYLSDVVVIGYGVAKRQDVTGSIVSISADNILEGKAAGIRVGMPINGEDASTILSGPPSIAELEDTINAPIGLNSLRHHFRDDAFWQPRLNTDEQGIAHFHVKFPDDITNWHVYAVAATGKKQTGMTEGFIKSFRVWSATLSSPSFAIAGDSIRVIGKIMNYKPVPVAVQRSFSVDGGPETTAELAVQNAHIDSFLFSPGAQDSIALKYTIRKKDGYFDGEERSIPVYRAGVKETRGVFASLEGDTSFRLSFDTAMGDVHLYAESSVLPVLLDEIENISRYEYLCNEQIASKLRALLEKKKVYALLHKEFTEEKHIDDLIARLSKTRKGAGLWGWWNSNEPSLWVSLHAAEALLMAEEGGSKTHFNKQGLIDLLVFNLESYRGAEKMDCIRLLQELHAHVDYKSYIDSIEKRSPPQSLYENLRLMELKKEAGMDIPLEAMIARHRLTVMGNWYWGEENNLFFDNGLQNTLLMYRLLKKTGGYEETLRKMRNYFLEKRRNGHWRNTYESCLILDAILPDLMKDDPSAHPPLLTINGRTAVSQFPFKTVLKAGEELSVSKKGVLPVYFTAFQQFWNAAPEKVSGEFAVQSYFVKQGDTLSRLKAGEPADLKITLTVKADADYILIEIPIPAGCSYKGKEQYYDNNEVHREYFRNKTSIFCRSLKPGVYTFTVPLLPRYTGSYHLNPARAVLMYFPVFYGREGMKKVSIF